MNETHKFLGNAKCLTIQMDGLTNVKHEPIMNWYAINEDSTSRLITIDAASSTKTGDEYALAIQDFVR
ncbi:unnamed protein product, partial [Aphanomyces euteiches]